MTVPPSPSPPSTPPAVPVAEVRVASNHMAAMAFGSAPDAPVEQVVEQICSQLAQLGATPPANQAELAWQIEAARAAAGDRPWRLIVLRGTPPVEPVHESIEWTRDFFATDFVMDALSGRVNYRERQDFLAVSEGELLARIVPGVPGAAGVDVFGQPVVPRAMVTVTLSAGNNVAHDPATRTFTATHAGRIRYAGNQLAVDETRVIAKSIGLDTGNVRFGGHVIVGEDVHDLAEVHAEGGLDVGDVIGAAQVLSGGDVTAGMGILGKGKGTVRAQGFVRAGYVRNADIQAGGSVVVHREIVQSTVCSRRSVKVEQGRIVGGEIVTMGDIVVNEAGSPGEVRTVLAAGENYAVPDFVGSRQTRQKRLLERARKLREELAALSREEQTGARAAGLKAQAEQAEAEAARLGQEIDDHFAGAGRRSESCIRVLRMAHPQVTFRIRGVETTVTKATRGPFVIRLNHANGMLEFKTN